MFSVVIPLYNKETCIKKTIQSVLDQICQDFEIVVVNDGSTDNSAQVVEAIDDTRIRLIDQQSTGVSAARNRGIQEASYDWVAFLDGDDLWEKKHLQEISSMMKKFPNEKLFATSFEYSDKRPKFRKLRSEPVFRIENYFREAIKESLMWTSIVVVHKSCIDRVGGFNEKLNRGEDLDLWARLARDFLIVKSQNVTAVYNVSVSDSLSKGKSVYSRSILSIIELRGLKSFERKYFKKMIYNRLILDIRTLDILEFLRILKRHGFELLID